MDDAKKRILIFLLLVSGLTCAYAFGLVWPAYFAGKDVTLLLTGYMCLPALGMVLTRLLTREGFSRLMLRPNIRGNLKPYLLAWLGPGVLVILGAAVYFLLRPGTLDLTGGYFRAQMEAAGMPYEQQAVPIGMLLAIQAVQGILLGAYLNLLPGLGEEWGWRGYLYPKLETAFGREKAVLLGGLYWGLWHAPLTALGHNYGLGYPGFPWTGIAAMCVFCIATGILLQWLTVKTESVIPAAMAHGALNGCGALGVMFTADGGNLFLGPAPTGLLGGLPLLLLAGLVLRRWRREKGPEP